MWWWGQRKAQGVKTRGERERESHRDLEEELSREREQQVQSSRGRSVCAEHSGRQSGEKRGSGKGWAQDGMGGKDAPRGRSPVRTMLYSSLPISVISLSVVSVTTRWAVVWKQGIPSCRQKASSSLTLRLSARPLHLVMRASPVITRRTNTAW